MVEQAVAYFFQMASEDTYSSANSTTYMQFHETSKCIKLIVCLCEGGGSGELSMCMHIHDWRTSGLILTKPILGSQL